MVVSQVYTCKIQYGGQAKFCLAPLLFLYTGCKSKVDNFETALNLAKRLEA